MASKKKRVVQLEEKMQADEVVADDEEASSGMDDDDSSDCEVNEEIQVEFEARTIEDSDFHGTRALLQQLFLKAKIDLSEMANTIISQNYIGSVIKQIDIPDSDEEDDDMGEGDPVLGLITVINITEKQNVECVKQFRSMLMEKCQACSQQQKERLSQILTDAEQQVGYLISERYINIPPQISVPMYESLFKEMEKCTRKKMKYDFGHYILISKCYRLKGSDQMFYTNAEEEFLSKECEFSFTYSVASERDTVVDGKWDAEDQMEAMRTVLVIPRENLQTAVANIKTALAAT
ncbi:protein BCCIP homolog [Mytilus californianus]|uniref:protein BCCIP homolog n=1 Tax=Mytilus californianus TaxID=6549 RepID=UPI0022464388|nr:protein BCCIP homolog [Mytilus californianus]